jgi:diacylglycerol kinase
MSYFRTRRIAFSNALSGLIEAAKTEVHFKLFLFIAFLLILFAFYFKVSKHDWLILLLCIGLVLSLELFNSAIEKLCDVVMTEKHPKIKYIKDVMAGAVLMACVFAAIIGLIIFSGYV